MATTLPAKRPSESDPQPRKRIRTSDLPLSSAQRTSINGILHAFKKRGSFDTLRKNIWTAFESSPAKSSLTASLTTLADSEIDRNSALLAKDRRQAAPLIEGAAERSGIYKSTEEEVEKLVDALLGSAAQELKDIRRKDVGDVTAEEEAKRGSKTDEEYAAEAISRRKRRDKAREEERKRQMAREYEALKKREEELMRQREERERIAREKAAEVREREERIKKQKDDEMRERAERKARQDAQWAAEQREKEEAEREKRRKDIEAAALEELLWEGKQAAARSSGSTASPMRGGYVNEKKTSALDEIMRREKMERGEQVPEGPRSGLERVDSTTSRRLIKRRTESQASPTTTTSLRPTPPTPTGTSEPKPPEPRSVPHAFERPSTKHSDDVHARRGSEVQAESSRYEYEREKHHRDEDYEQRRSSRYHEGGYEHRSSRYQDDNYDRRSRYYEDSHGPRTSRYDSDDERGYRRQSRSYDQQSQGRRGEYSPEYERDRSSRSHREREHDYELDHRSQHPKSYNRPSQLDHQDKERSPTREKESQREQPAKDSNARIQREDKTTTPAEIDRYVPSTSARAARPNDSIRTKIIDRAAEDDKGRKREDRSRSRDPERQQEKEHPRERQRDYSSRDYGRGRDRGYDRDYGRDYDRDYGRDRERDRRRRRSYSRSRSPRRDRSRERERRHRDRERDRDRDRDRGRDRDRDRDRRDRSRSRDYERRRSRSRSRRR